MTEVFLTGLLVFLVCGASAEVTYLMTKSRIAQPVRLPVQTWFEHRWADKRGITHESIDLWDEWQHPVAYLLSCSWCTGVYVAGAVTLVVDLTEGLPWPWLVWGTAAWVAGRWGGD